MALATGDGYYRTHNASADYLYKLLALEEDNDLISPIVEAITTKAKSPITPTTTSTGNAISTSGGEGGGEGGDGSLGEAASLGEGGDGSPGTTEQGRAAEGLGLGPLAASVIGTATTVGSTFAGMPGQLASALGSVAKGVAGEGLDNKDVANIGIYSGLSMLGVPGIAISAAKALGFDPVDVIDRTLNLGWTDIGSWAGPSDTTLGYGPGMEGRATAADQMDAATETTTSPSIPSGTYSGPKAADDFDGLAAAMADAVASYGDPSDSLGGDSTGDSGSNADGNSTGGGASSSSDTGGGANGGEDGGSSDGNSW